MALQAEIEGKNILISRDVRLHESGNRLLNAAMREAEIIGSRRVNTIALALGILELGLVPEDMFKKREDGTTVSLDELRGVARFLVTQEGASPRRDREAESFDGQIFHVLVDANKRREFEGFTEIRGIQARHIAIALFSEPDFNGSALLDYAGVNREQLLEKLTQRSNYTGN